MRIKARGAVVMASLLLVAYPASAQVTPDILIQRMDTDGDGRIAASEFTGQRRPFGFFDRNGDGFATRAEIAEAIEVAARQRNLKSGSTPEEGFEGFLGRDEIEMLLSGTRVSHTSALDHQADITFFADGSVRSTNEGGLRGRGKWWIKGPGVFCMDTFTGRMNKNFCTLLKRQGDRIYHYRPGTRTLASSHPWIIEAPGPAADQVGDTR